ncbi:hypothetical protein LOAG_18598 [Loa loa]|uniref:Amiloride-sensitive sodium channel family protein n=1 Tax=Loa loa TaxID=7209 RepID=A0A1S0UED9_LOALO|nr:hypothetical protein LOAG_18598 [Loa loa]EJD74030.1 hypothetical protein LOAG_18598 [Loa loa]
MSQRYITELFVSDKRKRILDDFAERTSAHGCILASKSQNAFMRFFWIIAILLAWIICTYQIWISIDKYYQYQTVVSIQIRHMTNIIFPAVTICNLNPIRASWLKKVFPETFIRENRKIDDFHKFTEQQWKDYEERHRLAEHITPEMRIIHKHLRLIFEKNINLSIAGHDINHMLIDCTYQSAKCSAKISPATNQQYHGFVGPLYGLSLTLYVADNEYLARHSQGSGFKVEIHPAEYIPFPEDKGFTISPGVMTSVGIKQMRVTRMPLPYDGTDCGDFGDNIENDGLKWMNASLYHKR